MYLAQPQSEFAQDPPDSREHGTHHYFGPDANYASWTVTLLVTEDTCNFNGADFGRYQHIVVVFNATFNSQSGTVIVPALTTAVFVTSKPWRAKIRFQ